MTTLGAQLHSIAMEAKKRKDEEIARQYNSAEGRKLALELAQKLMREAAERGYTSIYLPKEYDGNRYYQDTDYWESFPELQPSNGIEVISDYGHTDPRTHNTRRICFVFRSIQETNCTQNGPSCTIL
jgi:alkylation response protein AidB-like acyl-CoA dehydrogenase